MDEESLIEVNGDEIIVERLGAWYGPSWVYTGLSTDALGRVNEVFFLRYRKSTPRMLARLVIGVQV